MFDILDLHELEYLSNKVHQNAVDKGFWDEDRPINHCILLVVCEVCEVIEADRKGLRAQDLTVFKQFGKEGFATMYEYMVKDSVEDELADVLLRLLDIIAWRKWPLAEWINSYNRDYVKGKSFAEVCYRLIELLVDRVDGDAFAVVNAVYFVLSIADRAGINLIKHAKMKMIYNKNRPQLHGKIY